MFKEHEPPKEPASKIAERKWRNSDLRKRIKQAQEKPKLMDPNKEPEIAETITNDARLDGPINRFESKFKKEIREMMEGYTSTNLSHYRATLEYRGYRLLKEKLKRLQAAQRESNLEVGK